MGELISENLFVFLCVIPMALFYFLVILPFLFRLHKKMSTPSNLSWGTLRDRKSSDTIYVGGLLDELNQDQ